MKLKLNKPGIEAIGTILQYCYNLNYEHVVVTDFMKVEIQMLLPKVAKVLKRVKTNSSTKKLKTVTVSLNHVQTFVMACCADIWQQQYPNSVECILIKEYFLAPINTLK
ncbi:MAG TPA: hypothetical protein PKM40_03015 [Bacteroidia bacterium]|nr:hypothetical protein [Bacteroidia bacterium]